MNDKWADLRKKAEAATPGPWTSGWDGTTGQWFVPELEALHVDAEPTCFGAPFPRRADADWVAAANPESIQALLAEHAEAIELLEHVLRQFNLVECRCLPPCSIERAEAFLLRVSQANREEERA